MGHGLAKGEGQLVVVQWPFEQNAQSIHRAQGALGAGLFQLGQAFLVVLVQLLNPVVKPPKGFAVRWQGQGFLRQGRQLVDGVQELLHRVAQRLGFINADIGGDARQHHVATNQQAPLLASQGHVFR